MAKLTPEEAAAAAKAAAKTAKKAAEKASEAATDAQGFAEQAAEAVGGALHGATGGAIDPFVFRLAIFVLAIFVGYYVVWSVTPALHTPLMSVTNAISSVIIVGALLAVGVGAASDGGWLSQGFGFVALVLAAVNIFGGFLVTQRMLAMYKKKRERDLMSANLTALLYLVSGVFFILALRGLSGPETSRQGNAFGIAGMAIAIVTTLLVALPGWGAFLFILIGLVIGGGVGAVVARRIPMTAMPQLVAGFHSLVGLAAVLVAAAALYDPAAFGIGEIGKIHGASLIEMSIGVAIGAVTFTGSIIAFLKLDGRMSGAPILLPMRHFVNGGLAILLVVLIAFFAGSESHFLFWLIVLVALAIGVLIIIPIGGADMPVVISMLNSYSGWAAAGIGFTLGNTALIITGALVGSSGAILSYIMCKGMNRSFISVILGGFGGEAVAAGDDGVVRTVKQGSADDAAFILKNASKVIIVPGYGMAVAQAQHALREMADELKKEGVEVKYAIHPVAGRMPGHMNVLLAEANVPYDEVFELEDINSEFAQADVAYVIGANDVTNPAAEDDPSSPIYGMPVLQVWKAGTVMFVKRSLASGYAGIDNPLFYRDNTMMLLGDAKKMTDGIVKAL